MKILEEVQIARKFVRLLEKVPKDIEVPAMKIIRKGRATIRVSIVPQGLLFDVSVEGGNDDMALQYYLARRSELRMEGLKFLKGAIRHLERFAGGEGDASSS